MAGVTVSHSAIADTAGDDAENWTGYSSAELLQHIISNDTACFNTVTTLPEPALLSKQHKQRSCAAAHFSTAVSDIQPYNHPLTTHKYSSAHAQDLTKVTCFDVIAKASFGSYENAANKSAVKAAAKENIVAGNCAVKDIILATTYQIAAAPPELAVPLLPNLTTEQDIFNALLTEHEGPQLLPNEEQALLASAWHSIAGSNQATFDSCMANHMVLQDSFQTLPVIFFNSNADCDEAESCMNSWQHLLRDCHVKPIKTGHLELYIDLSLTDNTQSSPAELQAYKHDLQKAVAPDRSQQVLHAAASVTVPNSILVSSIAGERPYLQALPCYATQFPEQPPHAVQMRMSRGKFKCVTPEYRQNDTAVALPVLAPKEQQATAADPQSQGTQMTCGSVLNAGSGTTTVGLLHTAGCWTLTSTLHHIHMSFSSSCALQTPKKQPCQSASFSPYIDVHDSRRKH